MHLPAGSSPGTKNYLCLQIAFDSRELFLWPANRSGDENYPVCKLGIQGRQMKTQRSGSQKPWDWVSALMLQRPLCPFLGPGMAQLQNKRLGGVCDFLAFAGGSYVS